jgi:hypothetical protein
MFDVIACNKNSPFKIANSLFNYGAAFREFFSHSCPARGQTFAKMFFNLEVVFIS